MLRAELQQAPSANREYSDQYLLSVIRVMRERVSFVREIAEKGAYFFSPPNEYEKDVINKRWKVETPEHLQQLITMYETLQEPTKESYESGLQKTAESLGIGNGELIHAVRLAVSGTGGGPGVYDILSILGKEESIRRMKQAVKSIKR